jgi:hypothetical protein
VGLQLCPQLTEGRSQTALGTRDNWPSALKVLVNSCILPVPHCAAIFWGEKLSVVHNLAWGKARGSLDGQGTTGHVNYGGEALSALSKSLRGRTIKVGKHRPVSIAMRAPD